jgi:GT2 family glycosyltransferase
MDTQGGQHEPAKAHMRNSKTSAPVSVGIPTWGRGDRIAKTLERILECDPPPGEIIIFIDGDDKRSAEMIRALFPQVSLIVGGATRVGPGGGRHLCISAATNPFFVSFDDDSYPVDEDFFSKVVELFEDHPDAAVVGATIWHPEETEIPRTVIFERSAEFTGCGYAMRVAAYTEVRGYLPRANAYAMEETDVAIQFFARDWKIFRSGSLRVFHETDRSHHETREITADTIANIALFGYLHYPPLGWPRAFLQVINKLLYCLKVGRFAGMASGVGRIPGVCIAFEKFRSPLPWPVVRSFLALRNSKRLRQ